MDKGTGLAVVAEAVGVDPADVLVFGDMPNDLPMFAWAGWGRVAVANAHPTLLAAADEVTLSNDEDGVAVYPRPATVEVMHSPPPYRLVASDIDGTLIRTDGTLSRRTIDVLDRLADRGVPAVLVTGRPVRWLRQLYDQMDEPLPAVCANGAVVYDPDTDEVLRAAPLDVELLLDVTKRLREAVPDIALAVEVEDGRSVLVRGGLADALGRASTSAVRVLTTPEELTSAPAVKLLARSATSEPGRRSSSWSAARSAAWPRRRTRRRRRWWRSPRPASPRPPGWPGSASARASPPQDVVAFGDMPNDIPLLSWAGHSVAMGNAHPAVLEVADEVTLDERRGRGGRVPGAGLR